MPKVLFCATVDIHFKKFHLPYLQWFQSQGWEVHVASSGDMDLPYVDIKHHISIHRSPFTLSNMTAYRQLAAIVNGHSFDLIHCHTPMGGVLARLAARKTRKQGTKVIYTAHGFHFCKGAPLLNWLVYYPIEKSLAHLTDCLITINSEDYSLAQQRRFRAGRIEQVRGVGVNLEHYRPIGTKEKLARRDQLGYGSDDFLLFFAGEFNKNKNQQLLIRALASSYKDKIPHCKLLLAGEGGQVAECRLLASSLGVGDRVDFLGYRNDIEELLPMCDVAVASSLREGLPVNIMEAMACGLPIIATANRGHSELVEDQGNGFIVAPGDIQAFADRMDQLYHSELLRERMGQESVRRAANYSLTQVKAQLSEIYSRYAGDGEKIERKVYGAYS
ncbi:glycosyltransferase family 4 protein [Paenibacillus mendelii]|uniref:Glycosyltransferase family 4 protein n=1 Tax=Paenibacillus mendelii TaxID=206163 RepID=A0ABV6JKM9_9BACL|nr:glycosyltransferase family 4 protein [Paenibacillus mendelii]MCQ6558989.1 glycosyltransferase family 4 protein [Paenibacillus mendelii]